MSLAIKKIAPDYVFCGRQTLIGDTAQTGPMLSVYANMGLATNIMGILSVDEAKIICNTRDMGETEVNAPALLTIERINNLRLPSIRSKMGEVEVWTAEDIGADVSRCGLTGSPTRVLETKENSSGRRRCQYITADELSTVIKNSVDKSTKKIEQNTTSEEKLKKVFCVGDAPLEYAKAV